MNAAELLAGADERIERHRKADLTIAVTDGAGRPVPGAKVRVEQIRHAFQFGANIFQLFKFQGADHARYAEAFANLLNAATAGFYWAGYEPEPGKTVAKEDELRRTARWCAQRGIVLKGHPLVWHETVPAWAPAEADAARDRLEDRVTSLVHVFAGLIDRWDVVNEATVSAKFANGVGRWIGRDGVGPAVRRALGWARAAGPRAFLLYNDYNVGPDLERLLDDLVESKAPMDAIGIQSHMHGGEWTLEKAWEVCETYHRFGRPLHFTELTVLSGEPGWMKPAPWPTTPEGEARQARYVEDLYRLWFSHPAVGAIVWWDLMDGGWQGAPAGLLRADLSPKPAYGRLQTLVRQRWWTRTEGITDDRGRCSIRGFLGDHRVTVLGPAGLVAQDVGLSAGGAVVAVRSEGRPPSVTNGHGPGRE